MLTEMTARMKSTTIREISCLLSNRLGLVVTIAMVVATIAGLVMIWSIPVANTTISEPTQRSIGDPNERSIIDDPTQLSISGTHVLALGG
jgi:hypothetical protein